MKKLSIIFMMIILSFMVVGCNNSNDGANKQYQQDMSNGKSKVVEEEYDKAIDYFKLALESKKDDKEAVNLIKQLNLLVEVIGLEEEGSYFYQIKQIDKINAIKTETDVVKNKANEYKKTVLENIDSWIDDIEGKITNGDYTTTQDELEGIIEECKKTDSLKEQLKRCNKLLDSCKDKIEKEESVSQNNKQEDTYNDDVPGSTNYGKVWCPGRQHYVNKENFEEGFNLCNGCQIRRMLSSTGTYESCPYCDNSCAVSRYTGVCEYCNKKVYPAVKEIHDDGTVIFEDGSRW